MGKPTPQRIRDMLAPWLVGRVSADGEQRGYCPICEEPDSSKTPSASYNFAEGLFTCFSQCGGMNIPALVSMMKQGGDFKKEEKPPKVRNIQDAPSNRAAGKLPSEDRIEEFVDALLASRQHLGIMREERGLTKETIEDFQIGWDGERFTIPVRDRNDELVNVRRYNPKAKNGKDKMKSWAVGTGNRQLFGVDILAKSDTVIITEGEMDCVIGRQHGLPTISHTAGASAWDERWNEQFEGKIVYICYDCDDAGRRGARRVARSLELFAKQIHVIALPLKGNGDDLTNYFVDQGYTASDFYTLMKMASENANRTSHLSGLRTQAPKEVSLEDTMDASQSERPLSFAATIAGKVQPAYIGPKRVEFNCNEGGGARCARCPISGRNHLEVDIPEHDPVVLEALNKNTQARRRVLLGHVKIPPSCPDVEVDETEKYSVEEMILVPPTDEAYGGVTNLSRRIFNVGKFRTQTNIKARFTGMNTMDTENGRSILQAWESEESSANIDKFTMNTTVHDELSAFWPSEDQDCISKMKEISRDLEANVTKIYHRAALHIAYDLVWHSALNFRFKGQDVGKGWLELLVIGDTRTGKSEAAKRLCQHYRAGVLTTCEGATFAGLIGGVQQMSGNWIISWGVVPLNDRRLVVLDEFGGIADKGILEQMSSVRSSGIAQVNKIVSSETFARTRLVYIANPVEGVTISSYTNGAMDAVRGLAKNPEDIARFDFALSVASEDVKADEINAQKPPRVKHRYTSHLCGQLINWVWSRTMDQIVWERGVENYVLERAQALGQKYVPDPPLVQAENIRIKLARLAVAVAGRLFSTDESGENLIVDFEHVEAAEKLLNAFYGMESFGYREHSAKVIYERAQAEKNAKAVRKYLAINQDVLDTLAQCISGPFKMRDFQEFGGMSQLEAQDAVRQLQGWRVIRRLSKGYIRAEPVLVELVKKMDRE
jgi:hypothetical protein